jgi:hypothetical protein
MELWRRRWTEETWRAFLQEGEREEELAELRRCTHTGRPLGGTEFIQSLEQRTRRRLMPRKGGRPRQPVPDKRQQMLNFGR